MEIIKTLFWHPDEERLRMMWRVLLHGVLFTVLMLAVILPMTVIWVLQAGIGNLTDADLTLALISSPGYLALTSALTTILMIIVLFAAARVLDRRPIRDYGLQLDANWWRDLGFGLFLGAFLMAVIFLIELAAGWVTVEGTFFTASGGSFLAAFSLPLIAFVGVGIYEEMLSRGYHLLNFAEGISNGLPKGWAVVLATLISSAIFGVLHASNPNASLLSTFNIFLAGIMLSAGFVLTRSLAIPIGLHITWNLFQGNVFGFPVSGNDFRSVTVILVEQGGPDIVTGGAFGPEAGLLGIGAMIFGTLLTIGYVKLLYGHARFAPELTAYTPPANIAEESKQQILGI